MKRAEKSYSPKIPTEALEILFLQAKNSPSQGTIQDTLNLANALQASYETIKAAITKKDGSSTK